MKKIILIAGIFALMSFSLIGNDNYVLLFEKSNNIKVFKYGKKYFYEYFLDEKKEINGNDYYVEIRKYSWGEIDTTYIRKTEFNYLQFNSKTKSESVLLPIQPKVGDNWIENDGSWKYEVIESGVSFKTPKRNYYDCILVSCKQITNRDSDKSEEYLLYYSKEFGFVGNVDNENNVLSFLNELKLNTQKEDKINVK
ncbi:hypothetical protein [Flavobacterium eburneipallidum]|uniref:hypothetical protein n=1 Tax=Flavobacterium eburneipallidum TaxID=3003263 RepID=UPI0022ABD7C9|nr:hypothetical protein [Flavobacterium eburneipallidum]